MINKLEITVGNKSEKSYLKDSYFTRPFRLANVGEDKTDPSLYLMVQSSSPGILEKDDYDIKIVTESNTRLHLRSQSFQRLFKMVEGAKQKTHITLHNNSELSYVQHPIVPHEDSIFSSHNIVYLHENCVFTYGEIITCGRKHSGEQFKFKKFQNLTEIFYQKKLILKENVLLEPFKMDIHSIGQLEGYTHQGTLIHINTGSENLEQHVAKIHEFFELEEDITFGISQSLPNVIVVRILGNGGEQLFEIFKKIQHYLWSLTVLKEVTEELV
jgi:urease accessory protein